MGEENESSIIPVRSDISRFSRATIVTVRYKPEYGFSPKAYKGREIPIPDTLVARLKERKAKADKTCGLVFPTSGCKPKLNFLDDLKAVAERAKLDKDNFWLHKFRCYVRDMGALEGCRPKHGATMARAF